MAAADLPLEGELITVKPGKHWCDRDIGGQQCRVFAVYDGRAPGHEDDAVVTVYPDGVEPREWAFLGLEDIARC